MITYVFISYALNEECIGDGLSNIYSIYEESECPVFIFILQEEVAMELP